MANTLHAIQMSILRSLLFKEHARFSELNTEQVSNDHLSFHINQLLASKFITKDSKNIYKLTPLGKEYANTMDTDTSHVEKQAKVCVMLLPIKKDKGEIKYLVQQRLKQPYWGFYGFVTGKIRWGEKAYETAERELLEETGLSGTIKIVTIEHKTDYDEGGKLLEDKFFFIFSITQTHGALIETFEGGKNIWMTEKDIKALPQVFDDVVNCINATKQKHLQMLEVQYTVKNY